MIPISATLKRGGLSDFISLEIGLTVENRNLLDKI